MFGKLLKGLFSKKKKLKILILGLDHAGKTTFLNRLKLHQYTTPQRTMGAHYEQVKHGGLNLDIWDLGGQASFREFIWPKILAQGDANLILWVVDSSDRTRMTVSESEFVKLISMSPVEVPLGIIANKQDVEGCLTPGEVAAQLRLTDVAMGRTFQIFPCSMLTGDGIEELLNWVSIITDR